jgi:2,5-diamino-6-(ribosylamino)-4(3H)-pyrimidinone 5'-phosphate reductase
MTRPKVIIFNGISVDGRMDGGTGEVDMGLYYGLAATWKADAMLSGSSTMLSAFAGQEQTSAEMPGGSKELHPMAVPYLAVVDSRGQIHNWRQIQSQPFWDKVVALCSKATPLAYLQNLKALEVPYILAGEERVDFQQALEELSARFGIQTVRVDSGGVLNGVLLRAGLVDEVSVLLGPTLVGGSSPRSLFVAPDVTSPDQVIPLRLVHCERVKEDVLWLRYEIKRESRVEK